MASNKNGKIKCTSADDCECVDRICKALMFYEHTAYSNDSDELLLRFFEDESCGYHDLLNDYGHIIHHHLDGNRNQSNKQYQQIYHKITNLITCDIEKCDKYARNSRDRQKKKLLFNTSCSSLSSIDSFSSQTQRTSSQDITIWYYYDIMDSIHCNLLHSYDIGFRINYNQISSSSSSITLSAKNNDKNGSDDECKKDALLSHDSQMENIQHIMQSKKKLLKRLRGFARIHQSKYNTNFSDDLDETMDDSFILESEGISDTILNKLYIYLHKEHQITYPQLVDLNIFIQNNDYDTDSLIEDSETANQSNINLYLNTKHQNGNKSYFEKIQNFLDDLSKENGVYIS